MIQRCARVSQQPALMSYNAHILVTQLLQVFC